MSCIVASIPREEYVLTATLLLFSPAENSFVDFWGRLRSEASTRRKEDDESTERALIKNASSTADLDGEDATVDKDDDDDVPRSSLLEMAGKIDIEEIRSVLRNDQRYRAWKHRPELRDQWIRVSARDKTACVLTVQLTRRIRSCARIIWRHWEGASRRYSLKRKDLSEGGVRAT